MPETILETLGDLGLVPVVKIDRAENAVPLAQALIDGGLPCAEITFRTAAAEEAIRRIASALPQAVVGAGTVLSVDQAEKAVSAGAQFIVSPRVEPGGVSESAIGVCLGWKLAGHEPARLVRPVCRDLPPGARGAGHRPPGARRSPAAFMGISGPACYSMTLQHRGSWFQQEGRACP